MSLGTIGEMGLRRFLDGLCVFVAWTAALAFLTLVFMLGRWSA